MKKDGKFYTESVPFSCCSFDSTGPCIHDDVLQTYSRYDYNPAMKLTINTDGCSAVVSDTLQTTLVGLVLIGLSVVAVSSPEMAQFRILDYGLPFSSCCCVSAGIGRMSESIFLSLVNAHGVTTFIPFCFVDSPGEYFWHCLLLLKYGRVFCSSSCCSSSNNNNNIVL